jgi:hypothetical protein
MASKPSARCYAACHASSHLAKPCTIQQLTDYAGYFLFTAADPGTSDPVHLFKQPNWVVPFATDPVTLLTAPSQTKTVRLDRSHYMSPEAYDQFLRASGEEILQISPELELA